VYIDAAWRLIAKYCSALLDSINTRLVVKNYPVVLDPIKEWRNICANLPLGNIVVDLFFNHLQKHKQRAGGFTVVFREAITCLRRMEKPYFGATKVITLSTDFSDSTLKAARSELLLFLAF